MVRFFPIALLLAAAAVPAAAQTADPAKPRPAKKICHSDVPTGSLMPRSVCHTAAEWAQINAMNAESARSVQEQAQRQSAQP